jgi:hypothetical protein
MFGTMTPITRADAERVQFLDTFERSMAPFRPDEEGLPGEPKSSH